MNRATKSRRFVIIGVLLSAGIAALFLRSDQPDEPLPFRLPRHWFATNQLLHQVSATNLEFQAWGRKLMLKIANDHLGKVPLFGLKTPLQDDQVTITAFLTIDGAQLFLHTKDLKFRLLYENGILSEAIAEEAEMTGVFRNPEKFEHFGDYVGPWSKQEARKAAEVLVRAKGIDLKAEGARGAPMVREEAFNLPLPDGSLKRTVVFYTVEWADREGTEVVRVRFRRTPSGTWDPTYWDDNTRKTSDTESTNFKELYRRFFSTAAH